MGKSAVFSFLSPGALWATFWIWLALTVASAWALGRLTPKVGGLPLNRAFRGLLQKPTDWSRDDIAAARRWLFLDYGFTAIYTVAYALLYSVLAQKEPWSRASALLSWVTLAGASFDFGENATLWAILGGGRGGVVGWAKFFTLAKWVLPVFAGLYLVAWLVARRLS